MSRDQRLYRYGSVIFSVDYDLNIDHSLVAGLNQHFKSIPQCRSTAQIVFKFMFGEEIPDLSQKVLYTSRQKFIFKEYVTMYEGHDLLILQTANDSHYPTIIRHGKNEFQFYTLSEVKKYFFYIFRFIQEVLYTLHECRGWVSYHASGVAFENQGILILGPSYSGKTTLLSYLCIFAKANFIGNENILVKGINVLYDPTCISFRRGTIKAIEEKTGFNLNTNSINTEYTMGYDDAVSAVSPVELSKILGISLHTKCKIQKIIISDFQISHNGAVNNKKIELNEACMLLLENSISRQKAWNHKKLIDSDLTAQIITKNTLSQSNFLASKIPVIKITFGPNTNPYKLVNIITAIN